MNSSSGIKQLFFLQKSFFATSLYRYTARTNPKVYFTVSKDGNKLGDLVFELYQNHAPKST
jgi:hypothetical protein